MLSDRAHHQGFLFKKGAFNKAFKKRFFELRSNHLFYFTNEVTQTPQGFIELNETSVVEPCPTREFGFNISLSHTNRIYELYASTEQEYRKWLTALDRVATVRFTEQVKRISSKLQSTDVKQQNVVYSPMAIEDYEVRECIGSGTSGKVHKVIHKQNNNTYAMKILVKEQLASNNIPIQAIAEEKTVLQMCKHRNIVTLRYSFQDSAHLYIVTDFISGRDLRSHLVEKRGGLPWSLCLFYAAQVVLALEYLHKRRIIYRDLRPDNVVLDELGNAVIVDMGSVQTADYVPPFDANRYPDYIPPECAKGNPYSEVSDWWSLGVFLFELLTGTHPFTPDQEQTTQQKIEKGEIQFPDSFPSDAKSLISGLVEPDPSKRLGAARSFEITDHPYFADINWIMMSNGEINTPIVPVQHSSDLIEKSSSSNDEPSAMSGSPIHDRI